MRVIPCRTFSGYYADFGMLADVTDLYDDVDPNYYEEHFSEISRSNASGSDGRLYGVPKDKDNGLLVYNKEMFDAADVPYPTDDWIWEDLVDASRKIHDETGKYGFMAYNDDQLGYWCFAYQAGGHILTADRTKAGYTNPGTVKGIEFYVNMQKEDWCPDQTYFAETAPGTAFFSEEGAMYLEGNPGVRIRSRIVKAWIRMDGLPCRMVCVILRPLMVKSAILHWM